jgi:hypothetical protein
MTFFVKLIMVPHIWYDKLLQKGKKKTRRTVACILLLPCIIGTGIGPFPYNVVALLLLCLLGMWRMFYLVVANSL